MPNTSIGTLVDESIHQVDIKNIVDRLVPQKFKQIEDGKFYDVIYAFVENLGGTLTQLNTGFTNIVDINHLEDIDVIKIYHQTYLSVLNLDKIDSKSALIGTTGLFKNIKDITKYKGSAFLIVLLSNLLVLLVPSIRSTVKNIEDRLNSPDISDNDRAYYTNQLKVVSEAFTQQSLVQVVEDDTTPFVYSVLGDIDFMSWHRYIKPFAHPLGWHVNFFNDVVNKFINQVVDIREHVQISEMIDKTNHPLMKDGVHKSVVLVGYSSDEIAKMLPRDKYEVDNSGRISYLYNFTSDTKDTSVYIEVEGSIDSNLAYVTSDAVDGYDVDMMFPIRKLGIIIQTYYNSDGGWSISDGSEVGPDEENYIAYKTITMKEVK